MFAAKRYHSHGLARFGLLLLLEGFGAGTGFVGGVPVVEPELNQAASDPVLLMLDLSRVHSLKDQPSENLTDVQHEVDKPVHVTVPEGTNGARSDEIERVENVQATHLEGLAAQSTDSIEEGPGASPITQFLTELEQAVSDGVVKAAAKAKAGPGLIIGVTVVGVLVVGLLGLALFVLMKHRKSKGRPNLSSRLNAGTRVHHKTHGLGRVVEVDKADGRCKKYHVRFENGEVHCYSEQSAEKLARHHEKRTSSLVRNLRGIKRFKIHRGNTSKERLLEPQMPHVDESKEDGPIESPIQSHHSNEDA